jgi:Holliday junction resolvasome RuvABC DNA-binding subunit
MAQSLGPVYFLRGQCPPRESGEALDYVGDSQLPFLTDGGTCYLLEIFSPVLRSRLLMNTLATVYIAEVVREDADIYYAFGSAQERALFIEIKELKDIGPKVAATVVGIMGAPGVMNLVMGKEWVGPKIPGLGAKTLDTLKFGLSKKKEKFIKLLAGTAISPTENSVELEKHFKGAAISKTLRLGLEGLGMPSTVSLNLFAECLESDPGFSDLEDAAKLQVMLRRWGHVRMGGVVDR